MRSLQVALISTTRDSSPKVLAASLKKMLQQENVGVVEIEDPSFLKRLFPLFGPGRKPGALHFRARKKLESYFGDRATIRRLGEVDAIVFCVASPNAFWRYEFSIETLRKMTGRPIVLHEVYYLGNAPSQIDRLKKDGDYGIERYDWHLAVTPITEIQSQEEPPWSTVGLNLQSTKLGLPVGKKMQALVDFAQPGYEKQRAEILSVLQRADFPYIELTERLPMEEIRLLYSESSLYFLACPEAFGVPIAECLSCGTPVFVPEPMWAMSWRLQDDLSAKPDEVLAKDCFWVYGHRARLEEMLNQFRSIPSDYASQVRSAFLANYPAFYFGNQAKVKEFVLRLQNRDFGSPLALLQRH